jgi:ankyrin repeat protein
MSIDFIYDLIPTENEEIVLYYLNKYIDDNKNNYNCCNCLTNNFVCFENEGNNLLHRACMFGLEEVIIKIIDNLDILNININKKNNNKMSVLHYACSCKLDNMNIIYKLIENDADINSKNHYGYTPLHYACTSKNIRTALFLIRNGADLFIEYKFCNKTVLHDACENDLEVIACIIFERYKKYNQKLLLKINNENNYLHLFSMKKMENLAIKYIDFLINYKKNWNYNNFKIHNFLANPDSYNRTSLFYACVHKLDKLALKLINIVGYIDYGQEVNVKIPDKVKNTLIDNLDNLLLINNIKIEIKLVTNIYNFIY